MDSTNARDPSKRPVKAAICRCGCRRLLIYLWMPPDIKQVGKIRYRTVPCFPENWDGSMWYSGQVRRHPFENRYHPRKPEEPAEDRLE